MVFSHPSGGNYIRKWAKGAPNGKQSAITIPLVAVDERVEQLVLISKPQPKRNQGLLAQLVDEELQQWIARHQCIVLDIDDDIQQFVVKVVTEHPELIDFKNAKSSADAFLIATAMKYKLSVITEENKTSSKKIPKICEAYGIPCFNITELAEKEGWKF